MVKKVKFGIVGFAANNSAFMARQKADALLKEKRDAQDERIRKGQIAIQRRQYNVWLQAMRNA